MSIPFSKGFQNTTEQIKFVMEITEINDAKTKFN